jgi:ribonuclease P protein component
LKFRQTHLPASRAVVVVGKKVSKKATVRNRLRRRVAAELQQQWATVRPGYDIVLTLHSEQLPDSRQLNSLIGKILNKAGLNS